MRGGWRAATLCADRASERGEWRGRCLHRHWRELVLMSVAPRVLEGAAKDVRRFLLGRGGVLLARGAKHVLGQPRAASIASASAMGAMRFESRAKWVPALVLRIAP